jgi:hypothetical protein
MCCARTFALEEYQCQLDFRELSKIAAAAEPATAPDMNFFTAM